MSEKKVVDIRAARSKKNRAEAKKKWTNKTKEPLSPRRKKQIRRKVILTVSIVVILVATVGISSYKIINLKIEKNRLEAQQEELKAELEELKGESENVNSTEYIEQQARKQLHLVLPGEILYVLPESEDDQ